MSGEWAPDFCLRCDVQTDGRVYCSQACRLNDFDTSSYFSSQPSSPSDSRHTTSFTTQQSNSTNGFFLPPAFDFSPYRNSTNYASHTSTSTTASVPVRQPQTATRVTPASSPTISLERSSIGSDDSGLSDRTRLELRNYTKSFDQARNARKRNGSA
jgi:hypothetical protein